MNNFVSALNARFAGLAGPVGVILATCLINAIGIGMVWSILALYANSLGASTTVVGLTLAGFSATRLVVNVPAGHLTGQLGHRQVMAVGLIVLAAGSLAPFFVPSLAVLLVAVAVQGLGSAVFSTSALVAIAALSGPDTRVRDMANFQGAQVVGLGVGPALGGLCAAMWGYPATFLGQAVLALAAMAAIQTVRPLPAPALPPRPAREEEPVPLSPVAVAGLGLMTFVTFAVRIAGAWVLMPLLAQSRLGAGSGTVGLLLTACAIATLVSLPVAPRLVRKFGRDAVIGISTAVTLLALWLLGVGSGYVAIFGAAVLMGLSSAFAMPTLSAYAIDMAPPGRLGAAMGLFRTVTDLAVVAGPVLIGLLMDQLGFGFSGALIFAGAALAAANAVFGFTNRGRRT